MAREKYKLVDFAKEHNVSASTIEARLKMGLSLEESIQKEFRCKCLICDKEFMYKRPHKKYCCKTCAKRAGKGRGKRKQSHIAQCVVCGKEFETIRDDAITCSKKCRTQRNRLIRNKRYKHLKEIGRFDENVTLINVYNKYDGVCNICGEKLKFDCSFTDNKYPSIDHIIPLVKGGYHEWDNVQLLCRECNSRKRDD